MFGILYFSKILSFQLQQMFLNLVENMWWQSLVGISCGGLSRYSIKLWLTDSTDWAPASRGMDLAKLCINSKLVYCTVLLSCTKPTLLAVNKERVWNSGYRACAHTPIGWLASVSFCDISVFCFFVHNLCICYGRFILYKIFDQLDATNFNQWQNFTFRSA